jgi:hypothetical protein
MTNSHCTHPGGPAYCKSATCPGRARYLDFKNNSKPLIIDLPEANLSASVMDFFQDVANEADEIFNYAHELEFANHGDSKKEYLTLQNLIDNPKLMRGNCMPVTEVFIENNMLGDEYEVAPLQIQYNNGFHVAVEIKSDDESLILDFTMRQFDDEAPLPYIGKREEWESKIDNYVKHIWLDERKAQ